MPLIHCLGRSTNGMAIEGFAFRPGEKTILIMSGLHGDEVEGVVLTSLLVSALENTLDEQLLKSIFVLPIANPDGFFRNQRWNANKVDLNRNWPTKDWSAEFSNPRYPPGVSAASELETKALLEFVVQSKFNSVVDFHSYKDSAVLPLLAKPDALIEKNLEVLGREIGIPVTYEQNDLGYSIQGGLHTWCFEQGIHNFTLEIEKGLGQLVVKERYLNPVLTFLKTLSLLGKNI